jgi:hypothetical protein
VGRFGAANAGKLSGANLPHYGRDDFNFSAPLPPNWPQLLAPLPCQPWARS